MLYAFGYLVSLIIPLTKLCLVNLLSLQLFSPQLSKTLRYTILFPSKEFSPLRTLRLLCLVFYISFSELLFLLPIHYHQFYCLFILYSFLYFALLLLTTLFFTNIIFFILNSYSQKFQNINLFVVFAVKTGGKTKTLLDVIYA